MKIIILKQFLFRNCFLFCNQKLSDVNDVIAANAGGFRLYFDANYQMGYRYNHKPKINKETGEILEETG